MDLSLINEGFCQTPIFYYDDPSNSWMLAEAKGRMPPYDRFISDRAFGQKKRITQTPSDCLLPEARYLRMGRVDSRTFMVESHNEDIDEFGVYLNIYMVRECTTQFDILTKQKVPLPSGASRTEWVFMHSFWGDFDRYGTLRSSDLPIDYSSFTAAVLPSERIPDDCLIEIEGERFAITERFTQLDLRMLRLRGASDGKP